MELTGGISIGGTHTINPGEAWKPGGGSWSASSDIRVKKDVKPFAAGLSELTRIRPVTYRYNGLGGTVEDGKQYVGVIAQELEKVLPMMVSSSKAKLHPNDAEETDIKQVDPSAFTYVLINAVQEQQRRIESQDSRIAALEHGRRLSWSSLATGGFGCFALGLLPVGLVVSRRRRSDGQG